MGCVTTPPVGSRPPRKLNEAVTPLAAPSCAGDSGKSSTQKQDTTQAGGIASAAARTAAAALTYNSPAAKTTRDGGPNAEKDRTASAVRGPDTPAQAEAARKVASPSPPSSGRTRVRGNLVDVMVEKWERRLAEEMEAAKLYSMPTHAAKSPSPAGSCDAVAPITPGHSGPYTSHDLETYTIDMMLLEGFSPASATQAESSDSMQLRPGWVEELERVCGELARSVMQECGPSCGTDGLARAQTSRPNDVECAPNCTFACAVTQPIGESSSTSEDGLGKGRDVPIPAAGPSPAVPTAASLLQPAQPASPRQEEGEAVSQPAGPARLSHVHASDCKYGHPAQQASSSHSLTSLSAVVQPGQSPDAKTLALGPGLQDTISSLGSDVQVMAEQEAQLPNLKKGNGGHGHSGWLWAAIFGAAAGIALGLGGRRHAMS